MFINDNKREFYEHILKQRSRLLILVSSDLESITAIKILQYLLECDHILYTLIPIYSKDDLLKSFKEHSDGVKSILLVNVGITFDVWDFLSPEESVRIFIADNRRPIDVYNAFHGQQISLMTTISDINSIENELQSIPKYDDLFWESDEDEDELDVRQLSLDQLNRRNQKKRWEANRKALNFKYTQFSYYSYSTALLFFDLSWKLSKDNNELLWLAIVGVSDQVINGRINEEKSCKQFHYIREAMTRLKNIRGERGLTLNTITNNTEENTNVVTNSNHLNINYEKDLNLVLYRHWSVFESLRHSMYISCKFRIWKLRGHKRLLAFLAELGLPLVQCKQKFSSMDLNLRNNVKQWIEELSVKYDLTQIIGHSFIANRGFKHKLNANDVAFAARALLESADKDKRQNQKFFEAIDCLSWNNIELLEKGLDLAKLQLTAILKQVQIIVDSRQISLLNNVLWYIIIAESTPDANLFCYTGCLNYLARYALRAHASTNVKNVRSFKLPLIVITPNPKRPGMSMACGIPPIECKDALNFFSKAFEQIKDKLKDCQIETDLIDSCVAHLPYSERMTFLNEISHQIG